MEDGHWNVFRSHKRAASENPTLTKWMVTALQALKLSIFVVCSLFVTFGAVASKLAVLVLSTNLIEHDKNDRIKCKIHVSRQPRAAMYIGLALIQVLPDLVAIVQAVIKVYSGHRGGRVNGTLVALESSRAFGLSLLVFFVFPQLDIGRCAVLTACLPLISGLQSLMTDLAFSTRPANSFCVRMGRYFKTIPHFVTCLIMLSCAYLWSLLDIKFNSTLILPLAVITSSIGLWESWIGPRHEGTLFHHLYQVKYGVRQVNLSTKIVHALLRVLIVLTLMNIASADHVKSLWSVFHSKKHGSTNAKVIGLCFGVSILNMCLRGCTRFLATMDMRVLSMFHPMTSSPAIIYAGARLICNKSLCYFPVVFASMRLRWICNAWSEDIHPFTDWYIGIIWLLVGTYRAWKFVNQGSFAKNEEVIDSLSPWTSNYCVEQSLIIFQHSPAKHYTEVPNKPDPSKPSPLNIRNDEINRARTIYICATMWHETTVEMTQMLRSILKLDLEHIRRQNNKKADELQFVLECHIFFDDAWTDSTENGVSARVPNEFFKTFLLLMNEMTNEYGDEKGRMMNRVLVDTPYGGRVVIRLPAGTLLFVHLKDKKQIRHKKRWSQVMYMYYLLGHRIMDSPMSIEDKQHMADNTFVLAIDGDSKFEPEAVLRLLSLMDQKSDIGCACGRIHPIGSGVMVWYQKFEYAIAHWFQKAAEHVFGCVLCAPGCFSLFRASALMDDNIMHKYTKTAEEPRHFVQYDQGEDRWLSTLLLKQGYRIEYAAASDAETYAPEGFEEFFNQRRRWTPSSVANTVDLLADYKRAVENNNSISLTYIAYQFMVISFSMLGPSIIFSMVTFAQVAAFGTEASSVMWLNGLPIVIFVVLCFTTESSLQLSFAKAMSIIYAFVMLAVIVATSSQVVLETIVSPTSMFVVAMILIFFIAACLHPKEFTNVIYGIIFFLMVPSTYIFLSLYSLINLNVINWGTREAVAKATGKVETESGTERWLRRIGEGPLRHIFPCLTAQPDHVVEALERKLDRMEQQITILKNSEQTVDAMERLAKLTGDNVDYSTEELLNIKSSGQIVEDESVMEAGSWMEEDYLKKCQRGHLKKAEEKFWDDLITQYLKPIKTTATQTMEEANALLSLRNNIAFTILFMNALLVLAIYLIQKHKDVLSIKWTPYDGFTWTKMNEENGKFEETEDPLKIDPLGMGIIIFLLTILIVQTIGMLIHRLNTLIGAFQEVKNVHSLEFTEVKKSQQDERLLSAARQMMDAVNMGMHAGDGYTRHTAEIGGDENVLYKLQRARLSERMKRGALA